MRDEETLDLFEPELASSQPLSIIDTTESPDSANPLDVFATEHRRLELVPMARVPEAAQQLPDVDVDARRPPRPPEIAVAALAGVAAAICLYTLAVSRGGNATAGEAPAAQVAAVVESNAPVPIISDPAWDVPQPVPPREKLDTRFTTTTVAPTPPRRSNVPSKQVSVQRIAAPEVDNASSVDAPLPTATTGVTPAEFPEASPGVAPVTSATPPARPPVADVLPARAAVAPAPPPPAASTPLVLPRAAVESVLDRYANAFNLLDARRAKAVWPSVNERNLEKAFDTLERQEFDLGACEITVEAPRALAYCSGTASYTPKVGNRKPRSESRRWTFRLQQNGEAWSIESVDSR